MDKKFCHAMRVGGEVGKISPGKNFQLYSTLVIHMYE